MEENTDGSRLSKVCKNLEVESVYNVIVECVGYERERPVLIEAVRAEIGGNIFDKWNEDEKKGMCVLLGISGVPNEQALEHVKPVMVVNDHLYFGVREQWTWP